MKKLIPAGLTRVVARQILTMKKNSPRTMFVGGIVGIGVATVLACRATLRLEDELVQVKDDVDVIKSRTDQESLDRRRDLARVYAQGSYSLIRLYSPVILIGGASIGLLTASHVTLTRRNASLTAAYSALQFSFDQYMKRVREELGEDREREIRLGVVNEEFEINGKKIIVPVVDPTKGSIYARFFDEYNDNWKKNAELNKLFILNQQAYLNHRLHAHGHVFLNEAYDALGIPRSSAGAVVGWVRDKDSADGDGYIDFGIFTAVNREKIDFVNGHERSILLDFNVDGMIYELIDEIEPRQR